MIVVAVRLNELLGDDQERRRPRTKPVSWLGDLSFLENVFIIRRTIDTSRVVKSISEGNEINERPLNNTITMASRIINIDSRGEREKAYGNKITYSEREFPRMMTMVVDEISTGWHDALRDSLFPLFIRKNKVH